MSVCAVSSYVTTLVVCVLTLAPSFQADDNRTRNSNALVLTTKDFDIAVATTEHLFVQFREYTARHISRFTLKSVLAYGHTLRRFYANIINVLSCLSCF